MKKQFILISVALGAIAFTTGTLALSQNFKDVPTHHFAYEAILEGKESGLFKGYNDGTFKPDKNLSRGEMAVLLQRSIPYSPASPPRAIPPRFGWSSFHCDTGPKTDPKLFCGVGTF